MVFTVTAIRAGAQQQACSYRSCGLAVAARWNGLAVVRGDSQERIATLNFFVSRNLSAAFSGGGDSSIAWAARATKRRRIASTFTDVGLLMGVGAAVVASQNKAGGARTAAAVGGAMFLVSVPMQFSADNALSRAVWWHNIRFSGP